MVTAMAYPEAAKLRRKGSSVLSSGNNSEYNGSSAGHISKARYVLRNNPTPENQQYPDRCLAVMAGTMTLTEAYALLDEARETDRLIKRHINTTRYLLLDMRDRKGWKALGYESFKEYGEQSLGYEKAYLTRLADAGEISLQLGYDPELPIGNPPPESQLRPLKSVPEDVRKQIWDEATKKAEADGDKRTAKPPVIIFGNPPNSP